MSKAINTVFIRISGNPQLINILICNTWFLLCYNLIGSGNCDEIALLTVKPGRGVSDENVKSVLPRCVVLNNTVSHFLI